MRLKRGLRLAALDAEDLKVISACLQDALVRPEEMTFLEEERRFAAVVNRFMWEGMAKKRLSGPLKQIRSGVRFEEVLAVKSRGIDRSDPSQVLELLALVAEEPEGKAEEGENSAVTLLFAGGGEIRLEVERIRCGLEDLGMPWPSPVNPRHELD